MWFQKISIPPLQRITGNSEEEGVSKAKIVKGKYEPKMEFPEGWGWGGGSNQKKKPPWWEYGHFLEQHILYSHHILGALQCEKKEVVGE